MSNEISKFDDLIDSRDVISRIAELESDRDDLVSNLDEAKENEQEANNVLAEAEAAENPEEEEIQRLTDEFNDAEVAVSDARKALEEFDEYDEGEELTALKDLQNEAEGYSDWIHGATLIHDDYFEQYAQDLAEDLGMDRTQPWPHSCIDWEKAADELKQDYTSVDFDGETFWIR